MKISHTNSQFFHIICQILCHPLSKRCNEDLVVLSYFLIDFSNQIINLSLYRTHFHLRIKKTGRTDYLLRPQKLMFLLIGPRRRRYKHHLADLALKLFKIERPIVLCRRKTEPIVHQSGFSGLVSMVHPTDLWNRLVGLVNNHQKIIRKIIQKRVRRLALCKPCQMTGIILNPGTKARLPKHLNIKIRPL